MAKANSKTKKKVVAKKPSKPAKAKARPIAKKASKPAKKVTPKAKNISKPVKKAVKPAVQKAVKVKAAPVKSAAAKNNNTNVVIKAVKNDNHKPPVETKLPVQSVKASKKALAKKVIREELKPEPKHFYNTNVNPQVKAETKPEIKATKKVKMNVNDLNLRYSDDELKEFKDLIEKKLIAAREELHNLKETLDNHTESQVGNKAWNMEEGTDTSEMEYLMNQISRQHQYIRNLELAMVRVENKTYGICRVTGKLIPKERLRVVPHATLSLEAKIHRKADVEESPAASAGAPPSDFAEGFED